MAPRTSVDHPHAQTELFETTGAPGAGSTPPTSARGLRFYVGAPEPDWLARAGVPLFVSHGRLGRLKSLPRAIAPWGLDSRGFTELSAHGRWTIPARDYAAAAERYRVEVGQLDVASIQDWMCEEFITAKTGLTVREHQRRTVDSWLELRALAPLVPWMPVLQGWTLGDYIDCAELYDRADPSWRLGRVGLGSVCRRQSGHSIANLITWFSAEGLQLHGFGVKMEGLEFSATKLASADSMAWSEGARRGRLKSEGCTHKKCTSCITTALDWYAEVRERFGCI